jgi:prevent-host-death family protein
MRSVKASEFKAKCLAILDEVHDTGEPVVILKHGRPVARLVPPAGGTGLYPQDDLLGSVTVLGDLLEPVLDADTWEVEKGNLP